MEECRDCKKQTDNIELLPNEKVELIITPICEECYKKLLFAEAI